jgi:hypothetical protein
MAVLIGLCGFARSGKDEFADALSRRFGYVKLGWADALYEVALAIDPAITVKKLFGVFKIQKPLSKIVAKVGWTKAKENMEVRNFLQRLGTEVGREKIHPNVWIWALEPKIKEHLKKGDSVVVTNCRFENEAEAINRLGGSIIRVVRPGVGPVNAHSSEAGFANKHAIWEVINDGTIEDLEEKAVHLNREMIRPVERPEEDEEGIMVGRFREVCERALKLGVRYILQLSSPDPEEAEEWVHRNRVEATLSESDGFDKEVSIEVNGDEAGAISLNDGIIVVECYLAR